VKRFEFSLWIPREELLAFYAGRARRISARAHNGQQVELPAEALRRFVDHQGLKGRFEVLVTDDHRLIEVRRVGH
jgi:hypothetical protein